MKKYKFKINGNKYDTELRTLEDNIAEIEVNGTIYKVELEGEVKSSKTPKLVRPRAASSNVHAPKVSTTTGVSKILAPLPGTIYKVISKEGDQVKKGDTILIMEAMKMENNIQAEKEGIIKTLQVKEGEAVLQGDLLAEIE